MTTQLMLPAPVGSDEPKPADPEPAPPADPWVRAFEDLRRWKSLAWVDGDEEDES